MNKNSHIFVLCPDDDRPYGGVKQVYRHVDILNKNGFSAFVLHQKKGFRCTWFDNTTRIAYKNVLGECGGFAIFVTTIKEFLLSPLFNPFYFLACLMKFMVRREYRSSVLRGLQKKLSKIFSKKTMYKEVKIETTDCLAIPEFLGSSIVNIEKGIKKIIFNQNAHCSFLRDSLSKDALNSPYLHEDVVGAIAISEHTFNYLKWVFPKLDLTRTHNGIDSTVFRYCADKKKQIAFMPRKLPNQVGQVINILKFKNLLEDFELIAIENKTEKETAEILRESLIFLSFSTEEGFGMPPAEAMACGCFVIGYDGYGGKEFFKEEFCYPVKQEDVISFAQTVGTAIKEYGKDSARFLAKGKRASEFILKTYSLEREEKEVVDFWREMLNRGVS